MAEAVGIGRLRARRRARVPSAASAPSVQDAGSKVVQVVGRVLVAFASVVILFFVFELYLTPLAESRAQAALLADFKAQIITTTLDRPSVAPAPGSAVAVLTIKKLGVTQVVVEGTNASALKSGPGHLEGTPLPGEFGNSVIAGRRTTYGAPFARLDALRKGDAVQVVTGQGVFTYTVKTVSRVAPGQNDPILATADSRLTLMTSDPPFFASGRLVVQADLKGRPVALASRPRVLVGQADLGLTGDALGLGLGIIWGELLLVVLWVLWRLRRRWPGTVLYLIGVPLTLALLVLTFASVDMLFPATF